MVVAKKRRRGFRGNEFLRDVRDEITLSDDQINELKKCKADFEYFINNYVYIISLDDGEVLFKLFKYQKRFIRAIHRNRNVISMQSRQMGKTQVVAGYLLWFILFHKTKNVAIVANKAAAAREILSRIQFAYERLPLWMQQPVKIWNKGSIELGNGSTMFTAATSKSGIRGKSVNILYIDESAFIENNVAEDFFAAIKPTLSSGSSTKLIVTSTPRGYNHFHTMWDGAVKGTNGMVPVLIHYSENPKRNAAWAEAERKQLGAVRFAAEVECQFIGSSYTLINAQALSDLANAITEPSYSDSEGNLAIYEAPVRQEKNEDGKVTINERAYFLIADVSRGVGGDYSTCLVVDATELPYRLVARYRDNEISPLLFPSVIQKLGMEYNEAFVLIEINDNGQQIADILHDELEYTNILTVKKNGTKGQILDVGFGKNNANQLGVRTTKQVKSIGCGVLKTIIEEKNLLISDKETIVEFSTFIEQRGSYAADDGYHDDLVMPLVLFSWATTQMFFKDLVSLSIRNKIFAERMTNISNNLTPFIMITNGVKEMEAKEAAHLISSADGNLGMNSSYETMSLLSSGELEDLRWLLAT
jgi:hypothetical protein